MEQTAADKLAEKRQFPAGLAYFLVVVLCAAGNAALFSVLIRKFLAPALSPTALLALGVSFGILFAGASSMSATSLCKHLNRSSLADRILSYLLVQVIGCTLLTCLAYYVAQGFAP